MFTAKNMPELSKYPRYRLLEMIPGSLVWITLIGAVVLSFIRPLWAIYIIIVFDFYWLVKVLYWLVYLFHSYRVFKRESRVDWLGKVEQIKDWGRIRHLIVLPTYKEPLDVLLTTFDGLAHTQYPLDRMMIVIGVEERDKENGVKVAEEILRRYNGVFGHLTYSVHPFGIPGELPGKGTNSRAAVNHIKATYIDPQHIPYEDIIISTFDVDTCVDTKYFAHLSYKFLTHPTPHQTSYQPIAFFNNNMWRSSAITRIVSTSTTFWLLTELSRPERLFTFSSHSMSFKTLLDVGMWQKDIVTEDSRIFLQCFLHFNGAYTVTPLFVSVSMDTVQGETFWKTVKALYHQQQRWAWGVEHFPYMVWHFAHNKSIPWLKKLYYFFNLAEGMYSWATAPILILILGRLPFYLAHQTEKATVLAQNAPFVLERLMQVAMVGLICTAVLSVFLLPKKPADVGNSKYILLIVQWILFPITTIVFGAIPAIDAQTRLLFGWYLGFNVTPKVRNQPPSQELPAHTKPLTQGAQA